MPDTDPPQRDAENPTYVHDTSTLYGVDGEVSAYQRQKFAPLLDAIERAAAPRRPEELSLLDVGIGYGVFLRLCDERGFGRLAGMDPYPDSIRIAERHTGADRELLSARRELYQKARSQHPERWSRECRN